MSSMFPPILFCSIYSLDDQAMGAMNKGLNLPQIQRIMMEFERESATMDMKETMMSEAVDDVMDDDLEDEEEEGDKILKQVLDEIGVDLSQQVSFAQHLHCPGNDTNCSLIPAHRRSKWTCHLFSPHRTAAGCCPRRSVRRHNHRWRHR